MESEKVKEIKELLRCMNGEKGCTNCYINEIAQEQETCCINIVADMTLELIDELESENEKLKQHKRELEGGQRDLLKVIKEFDKETQQLKDENERLRLERDVLVGKKIVEKQKHDKALMMKIDIQEQLKDRIAELEKEKKENLSYAKGYADGIKNTYEFVMPDKLTQFAEMLKEKFDEQKHFYEVASISHRDISITALNGAYKYLDETLKEFISE